MSRARKRLRIENLADMTIGAEEMKAQELRVLGDKELKDELEGTYKELFSLRFRLATMQLTNVCEIRKTRKKVAQIKTIIRERELALE